MNILNFRLRGKLAHFRRYYSNTSALSYSVPPRTTIVGLIAGLLGYERDSYYREFAINVCKVAVGIRGLQKKKVHTLNLLHVKGPNDLNGSKPFPSQTQTEIISPVNIRNEFLDYEIWFHHEDPEILKRLKPLITLNNGYATQGASLALGTAQHLGWLASGREITGSEEQMVSADIHSIIPVSLLLDVDIFGNKDELFLVKEDLPIDFHADRILASKGNFLINTKPFPVKSKVKRAVCLDDGRFITWMEA